MNKNFLLYLNIFKFLYENYKEFIPEKGKRKNYMLIKCINGKKCEY